MYKILLAEDDVEMLEGLTRIIDWESHGFSIAGAARNGADALNLAAELLPDVIITDITMPVMGGLELIREVKKLRPDVKSIIISCHEEFEYAREAVRLQADEYLLKHTLTDEALIQTINKLKQAIDDDAKQLQKHFSFEPSDSAASGEQAYRLAELAGLYDIYAPMLKNAVKERDSVQLIDVSKELLVRIAGQYHPASTKAMLSRLLIEAALVMPDSSGISVEALQLKDSGYPDIGDAFKHVMQLMADKLASYQYNTSNPEVLKAIAYINNNLGDDISCNGISRYINMNSSYFSRLFKQETGLSFSDFVLQKRIQKASELLRGTTYSIDEIMRMVGISSASYFYRIYKRMTGNTPGDVRSEARKSIALSREMFL